MEGLPLLLMEFLVVVSVLAFLWWDVWRSGSGDDDDDSQGHRHGDGSST